MTFEPENDAAFVHEFDWNEISPPAAVIEAMMQVTGKKGEELDTLYSYVDPDALEAIVTSGKFSERSTATFVFDEHRVAVSGDGTIRIYEATD